jgi:hypothetical protein
MFKVGDKVKCIDNNLSFLKEGKIYTISVIDKERGETYFGFEENNEKEGKWISERFEKLKNSNIVFIKKK